MPYDLKLRMVKRTERYPDSSKPATGSEYRLRYAKVEITKIKTHNCHNCVKFENMSCGKR